MFFHPTRVSCWIGERGLVPVLVLFNILVIVMNQEEKEHHQHGGSRSHREEGLPFALSSPYQATEGSGGLQMALRYKEAGLKLNFPRVIQSWNSWLKEWLVLLHWMCSRRSRRPSHLSGMLVLGKASDLIANLIQILYAEYSEWHLLSSIIWRMRWDEISSCSITNLRSRGNP